MWSPGYGDVAIFQRKWSWRVARSWCSAKLKIAFNRHLIYCLGYGPHECCFSLQILKIRTKGYFPPAFTADGVVTVAFIVEQKISSKCRISVHHSHKCVSMFKGKQEAGIQIGHCFSQRQFVNLRPKADFQETRLLAKTMCSFCRAFQVCL